MSRLHTRLATALVGAVLVLLILEYGGFEPAPSRFVPLHHAFVVALLVGGVDRWAALREGSVAERVRRRRGLARALILGLSLALVLTAVAVARFVVVAIPLLVYVYATVATLGLVLAVTDGGQTRLSAFGVERRSRVRTDRRFFVALVAVAAALFAYHPTGLDAQLLGVLLFFGALLYYANGALVTDD